MVGRGALDPVVEVRVLLSQPLLSSHPAAPSSRGLGHGPLKAETRVRLPLGPPTWIHSGFPQSVSVPPPRGRKPLLRGTSGFLVEEIHHSLQIERRQPRVDGGRLNIGVAQMLLHSAEIPTTAAEQLDAAGVTERVRVDGVHAHALAEILDDFPDPLTRDPPGLALAAIPPVADQEQRLAGRRARSVLRQILAHDRARNLWQRHGALVPAFPEHATQPELRLEVADVQPDDLGPPRPTVDQDKVLPHTRRKSSSRRGKS